MRGQRLPSRHHKFSPPLSVRGRLARDHPIGVFLRWQSRAADPSAQQLPPAPVQLPVLIGSRAACHFLPQFATLHRVPGDVDLVVEDRVAEAWVMRQAGGSDFEAVSAWVVDSLLCKLTFRRRSTAEPPPGEKRAVAVSTTRVWGSPRDEYVEFLILHHLELARWCRPSSETTGPVAASGDAPAHRPRRRGRPRETPALVALWLAAHSPVHSSRRCWLSVLGLPDVEVVPAPLALVAGSALACAHCAPSRQWFKRVEDASFFASCGVYGGLGHRGDDRKVAADYLDLVTHEVEWRARREADPANGRSQRYLFALGGWQKTTYRGASVAPVSRYDRRSRSYVFGERAFFGRRTHSQRLQLLRCEALAVAGCLSGWRTICRRKMRVTRQTFYSHGLRRLCTQLLPAAVRAFLVKHYPALKFRPTDSAMPGFWQDLSETHSWLFGYSTSDGFEWLSETDLLVADFGLRCFFRSWHYISDALAPFLVKDVTALVCGYDGDALELERRRKETADEVLFAQRRERERLRRLRYDDS